MSTASQKLPKEKVVVEEEDRDDDSLSAEPPTDSVSPENNKRAWEHALHNKRSLSTLQFQYDVNFQDEAGTSLLHLSAFNGNTANVTFLLSKGALVDITDKCGSTPLHVAASFNSDKVLDMLISKHADVNKKVNRLYYFTNRKDAYFRYMDMMCDMTEGFTPLHCAAAVWSPNCIQSLLKSRANIEIGDVEGRTPLFKLGSINFDETSEERYLQVLRDFQSRRAKFSRDGYNCLKLATCKNWSAAVHWLLLQNAKLTDVLYGGPREETILHVAAGKKRADILTILLKKACREIINDARGNSMETPLWQAIDGEFTDGAQILLDKGADYKSPYLLHKVVSRGMSAILQSLITMDKNWCHEQSIIKSPEYGGMNCFHLAAGHESSNCLKYLYKCYPDTEETSDEHVACTLLQKHLPVLEERDDIGQTPLHCAANSRSKECIQFLLEKRCSIAAKSRWNRSAMQMILKNVANGLAFVEEIFTTSCMAVMDYEDLVSLHFLEENEKEASDLESQHWVVLNFGLLCLEEDKNQMSILETLMKGIQHERERRLFCHPLVQSFVYLKWQKIKLFFWIYFIVYCLYVLTITTVIFVDTSGQEEMLQTCKTVLTMSCIFVLAVQLPGVVLHYIEFIWQIKPFLVISPPIMGFITALGDTRSSMVIRSISAFAILFAWISILEQTTRFSGYGRYAFVYLIVMERLLKVFLLYLCVNVGFSLAFYIIMIDDPQYDDYSIVFVKYLALWACVIDFDRSIETPDYSVETKGCQGYVEPSLSRVAGMSEILLILFIIVGIIGLMNFIVGENVTRIDELEADGDYWQIREYILFLWNIHTIVNLIKTRQMAKLNEKLQVKGIVLLNVTLVEKSFPHDLAHLLLDLTTTTSKRDSVGSANQPPQ